MNSETHTKFMSAGLSAFLDSIADNAPDTFGCDDAPSKDMVIEVASCPLRLKSEK